MIFVGRSPQMVGNPFKRGLSVAACGLLLALAAGGIAQAQSNNGSSLNAGYGRSSTSSGNYGVSATGTRDANGNRVIIDGIIQGGLDQSSISQSSAWGSASSGSGAGFGGATAIGNNLSVITQGNWNTVIVNSTQINNGNVTANGSSGGVGNDDGN
jgi:holdfast attachment protein HfaA